MRAPTWLEMTPTKDGALCRVQLDTWRQRLAFAYFCALNVSPWWRRPEFVLLVLASPAQWFNQ